MLLAIPVLGGQSEYAPTPPPPLHTHTPHIHTDAGGARGGMGMSGWWWGGGASPGGNCFKTPVSDLVRD